MSPTIVMSIPSAVMKEIIERCKHLPIDSKFIATERELEQAVTISKEMKIVDGPDPEEWVF